MTKVTLYVDPASNNTSPTCGSQLIGNYPCHSIGAAFASYQHLFAVTTDSELSIKIVPNTYFPSDRDFGFNPICQNVTIGSIYDGQEVVYNNTVSGEPYFLYLHTQNDIEVNCTTSLTINYIKFIDVKSVCGINNVTFTLNGCSFIGGSAANPLIYHQLSVYDTTGVVGSTVFKMSGCSISGSEAMLYTPNVFVSNVEMIVDNSSFYNNTGSNIFYLENSTLALSNSIFYSNFMRFNLIQFNEPRFPVQSVFTNVTFNENRGNSTELILQRVGVLTIKNSVFTGNWFLTSLIVAMTNLTVEHTTFANNSFAANSSMILGLNAKSLTMIDNTFTGNHFGPQSGFVGAVNTPVNLTNIEFGANDFPWGLTQTCQVIKCSNSGVTFNNVINDNDDIKWISCHRCLTYGDYPGMCPPDHHLSIGAIVGIAVGGFAGVCIIVVLTVVLVKRSKRTQYNTIQH
ncbi:hypothetical protein SAMD00019534_094640 [Acytostelium subglobosum LB1]|uniref:hypothetical protein n=1 Tax=Acytostelium subglobosum LB1 TaxID=1410327 RepID=UPI00064517C8|nr:hypothetical protein SAMD00019534_094640 [Acytostelium subglobosum LB1]GAM26289.1 hypothetical protein SAMD00019534_094640 [Acytostelium subglobosum LB1]|eukprot:XP_012750843.1 hypothetical protein SAMD00019534_094640 [Acytostelium subglobosum LB1]